MLKEMDLIHLLSVKTDTGFDMHSLSQHFVGRNLPVLLSWLY